ncbi:Srb6p NDAI_0E03550 [Naumovozyma dairenensis CBS 421]|uniref:Mediator of RNA polymerase II transcription subunit 22 n=1 Tax=Naumovozyma dairenensis (strain ATCC 10597 / BCRC 20456 / CBS 421 / NBRC 0211 / NRRL Y-12639) TaxID=1071378 RepID=G0WBQ2_NAUDC|nr:hypothetical protein NDAI_0E03550 [Naumovozyma dairenensis CBS 421]CCD25172.1 hypothetical protein NDAI_0E03550 [Naumovozyma dairenensis CBS 421]
MNNQALFEKLDQTVELLSLKLAELIRLSSIDNPESANDNIDSGSMNSGMLEAQDSNIAIATTSMTMVYGQTMQLIRGVQDLLVMTRGMREMWLLNQIPDQDKQNDNARSINHEELASLLNTCMQEIIGEPPSL